MNHCSFDALRRKLTACADEETAEIQTNPADARLAVAVAAYLAASDGVEVKFQHDAAEVWQIAKRYHLAMKNGHEAGLGVLRSAYQQARRSLGCRRAAALAYLAEAVAAYALDGEGELPPVTDACDRLTQVMGGLSIYGLAVSLAESVREALDIAPLPQTAA